MHISFDFVAMIHALVKSAFQTGYLSVESEGLIRQVLDIKGYKSTDIEALEQLYEAITAGQVKREAQCSLQMPFAKNF
jgi:hypothetical protein